VRNSDAYVNGQARETELLWVKLSWTIKI